LERKVVLEADAVVGVTQPIADDLRRRFEVPAVVITNGFDPEERTSIDSDGLLDPGRHSLVYTGGLAYAGRTPEPLLKALRRLRELDLESANRLEIVFARSARSTGRLY
jgi:hypothetical protein